MDAPTQDQEQLKLSDRLAIERTILASDRSLLAWVRTSLSLIGFGFTIYKFLQSLMEQGVETALREQTPRNIGIFLLATGTLSLLLAVIEYVKTVKRLYHRTGVEVSRLYLNPNFLAAGAVFLLGAVLLFAIVFRIRLL
jgi:putative membrane protein